MGKALVKQFDFDGLDKSKLNYFAGQFTKALGQYADSGMAVGKVIHEAHVEFANSGKEGRFSEWVESCLTCSRQTAYNYMWAYERFGSCKTILQFDSVAMYKLAAPGAPEAAAKEAVKLADKGERIDSSKAKELLDKHSDKPKPTSGKGKSQAAATAGTAGQATTPAPPPAPPPPVVTPEDDEPVEELDFDGQVKAANKLIESFCRSLVSFYEENCPKLESINYQGRYDSALAHVKASCGTLRTCKYHDKPCPKCGGDGCASCAKESDFGAVTAITFRALAG